MMRLWYAISYVCWILVEIIKGSVQVAWAAYRPGTHSSPAIVEYPLRATTDFEIISMASSITITPGTLVVGTAHGTLEEGPSLFVHVLFADSREQVVADLAEMEERLLRATRGRGGADARLRPRRGGLGDQRFTDTRAAHAVRDHGVRTGPRGSHPEPPGGVHPDDAPEPEERS